MKLTFVLGTAAELIKIFPIYQLAQQKHWSIQIVSTGQSGSNFRMQCADFKIENSYVYETLPQAEDLKSSSQALKWFIKSLFTSKRKLKKIISNDTNWVLVHGDTLSTLIGALWAKRLGVKVAHIEAGLRSHSLFQPFPEEICRRWVSHLVDLHFVPDSSARENLTGTSSPVIETSGNTLKDLILDETLFHPPLKNNPYCLINVHRFENLSHPDRWNTIIKTVLKAATKMRVLFVMHPQTESKLQSDTQVMEALLASQIELIPRLPMTDFIRYLKGAEFVISDGGSNQEECSYLGVPCLIMREKTERKEGLDHNCILSQFNLYLIDAFLENPNKYRSLPLESKNSPSQIVVAALEDVHAHTF